MSRHARSLAIFALVVSAAASRPVPCNAALTGEGLKRALIDTLAHYLPDSSQKADLVKMVGGISYGVPSSPAFELLPNKPSEVTHVLTPHDFQSAVSTWFDGNKLRLGIAVDSRPFVQSIGDITDYQASAWRQILFRTVIGLGTSAATEGSRDVIGAVGARISLLDRGDPRLDSGLQEDLARAINAKLTAAGQPRFGETAADVKKRLAGATQKLRDEFVAKHWNATRVDVGFAGSARLTGGAVVRDSLEGNRVGVYVAASTAIGRIGQAAAVGKAAWIRPDSASQETGRHIAGARLRVFPSESVSLSVEAGRTWSRHERAGSLDERWNHYAAVLEWYIPEFRGWLGIGYGGDTSHRDRKGNGIELKYAFYHDNVVKR